MRSVYMTMCLWMCFPSARKLCKEREKVRGMLCTLCSVPLLLRASEGRYLSSNII